MEIQCQKIIGHRDLSQEEIDLINQIKSKEVEMANFYVDFRNKLDRLRCVANRIDHYEDGSRQAAIAANEMEHVFMRLVRAVAEPSSPWVCKLP